MAVVNSDFLSNVRESVAAIFRDEFPAAVNAQAWTRIVSRFDTPGKETQKYDWFGSVPVTQEVTHGTLTLAGLGHYNFSITNKLWKAGFEVSRQALERDNLDQIGPRTRQLAAEMARHPGKLVWDLFTDNGNAFDGTAFFANTRAIGSSANVDNIQGGSGTSAANIRTDIGTMRATMMRYQDDQGRPMNRAPNVFVIPPDLSAAFYEALNVGGGSDDVAVTPVGPDGLVVWQARGYTVIETAYFSDANDWFGLHVGADIAPFVWQVEVEPVIEGVTSIDNITTIVDERLIYTGRGSYNVGYGDPRTAIQVTN